MQLKRIELATQTQRTPLRTIAKTACFGPVTRPKKLNQHSGKFSLPTIVSTIPAPKTSTMYTPTEMLSILSPYPKRSPTRQYLVNHFVKEGLVPVQKRRIYTMLQRQKKWRYRES